MGKSHVKIYQLGYDNEERLKETDKQTSVTIGQQYPIEDQIKLLRRALAELGVKDPDFLNWHMIAEKAVSQGRVKKSKLNINTPAVDDHDEKIFKPEYPDAPVNLYIKAKRDIEEQHSKELLKKFKEEKN